MIYTIHLVCLMLGLELQQLNYNGFSKGCENNIKKHTLGQPNFLQFTLIFGGVRAKEPLKIVFLFILCNTYRTAWCTFYWSVLTFKRTEYRLPVKIGRYVNSVEMIKHFIARQIKLNRSYIQSNNFWISCMYQNHSYSVFKIHF